MSALVHGIVSVDPPRIECDECGYRHTGESGKLGVAVILSGIRFNPRTYSSGEDRRRMCRYCARLHWGDAA